MKPTLGLAHDESSNMWFAVVSFLEVSLGNNMDPCVATESQREGRGPVLKSSTDTQGLPSLYINMEQSCKSKSLRS